VSFVRRPADADGSWAVGAERLDRAGYVAVGAPVRRAFGQRRKQLANSLSGVVPAAQAAPLARADVARALAAVGAPATARPEELDPERWIAFVRELGGLAAS
jgi:16S rRNA A1518/A1519 N6-dimethyltransferase RsmA/KsgA/DIM1 with predicted DNA glycosylase/AP lyase activity